MDSLLYNIEDLYCGYNGNEAVLVIPKLKIIAGNIYVILGKSGSGKSTFLETLALMNKTIQKGDLRFSPPSLVNNESFDFLAIWGKKSEQLLSEIRSKHFSFIFQQTNLMSNFTVWENIYVTRLIQGFDRESSFEKTKEILGRLGMQMVDSERKVTELSGGQRQRVAFARAIVSGFDVLFGDEPTGNLDEKNAVELLKVLKENLHKGNNGTTRSAIIVSHSISLAMLFADRIIAITKDSENDAGIIHQKNCFQKTTSNGEILWSSESSRFTEEKLLTHLSNIL